MSIKKFRMAFFGDFTGRSARGLMETGSELAQRRQIKLDVDTLDDVIEGFGTSLVLPIGKDGAGIEVELREMDDLHPDELYEKVEMFEALGTLKQSLGMGSMSGKIMEDLKGWGETYGTKVKVPKRSAGAAVPANLKLTDFQALIGDTERKTAQASPVDDLMSRVVGPYVVKAPDEGVGAMQEAVDEAISDAMRLILHHPDFQAVESTWRSIDMLARRIETDAELELILFDISAEELAADLTRDEPGLRELLEDEDFTALFGLYTFEETPPHAELLGRIARVAADAKAPFFTAMSPAFMNTKIEDRPSVVAEAWTALREMPEAAYLGLASPRFMLRRPYGAKSDPIYEFEFEEFTLQEGLKGMLWANPVIAIAVLMAATFKKDGAKMSLGSIMTLGEIAFHYMTDQHGDQIALPCTERNLSSSQAEAVGRRGIMPLVSIKGRDQVKLASFQSIHGGEIAGAWSDLQISGRSPAPVSVATIAAGSATEAAPGAPAADLTVDIPATPEDESTGDSELDDLLADLESTDAEEDDIDLDDLLSELDDDTPDAASEDAEEDLDTSLDDLLASFDDDDDDDDSSEGEDDMDDELAALLEGL